MILTVTHITLLQYTHIHTHILQTEEQHKSIIYMIPTSTATNATNQSAIAALTAATKDLQSRNEIQDILHWMIHDIETTTSYLQTQEEQTHLSQLEHKIQTLTNELEEHRAIQHHNQINNVRLGDTLVGELFVLSLRLHDLETWKAENMGKVEEFEDLLRKHSRLEELIRGMKRTASLNMNAMRDPSASPSASTPVALLGNDADIDNKVTADDAGTDIDAQPPLKEESQPSPNTSKQEEEKTAEEASIINKEKEVELTLETLNGAVLLEIFSYLDAMDIFQVANVNASFYSKIDTLFGFGDTNAPPINTPDSSSIPLLSSSSPHEKETIDIMGPTVVKLPPLQAQNPPTSTNTIIVTPPVMSTSSLASSVAVPLVNQMFARFQQTKKDTPSTTTPTTASVPTTSTKKQPLPSPTTSILPGAEPPLLNTAMANSMADKLSPSELSVIISMTEKLRLKQTLNTSLQAQVDDLTARLDGTESVKNFLITKLRDTELSLQQTQTHTLKLSQQTSTDQEVIAFLDSKVQTLESTHQSLQSNHNTLEHQHKTQRIHQDKKMKVMEDLLLFERQQLNEQEGDFKKTKKLLVKEVKHGRAQIVALQAERDSFYQQNLLLKKALMSEERENTLKAFDNF